MIAKYKYPKKQPRDTKTAYSKKGTEFGRKVIFKFNKTGQLVGKYYPARKKLKR